MNLLIQASRLISTLRHSEDERLTAVKRRGERLASFKKLQDQLLHPPKLSGSRGTGLPAQPYEMSSSHDVQRRRRAVATDDSWRLSDEPAQRDRAQRAHALAVAAANAGGNKVWGRETVSYRCRTCRSANRFAPNLRVFIMRNPSTKKDSAQIGFPSISEHRYSGNCSTPILK